MAYIAPDTSIKFCKVPGILNSTYEDTVCFNNITEQQNYFNSKVQKVLNNYSIVKDTEGKIRVEGSMYEYLQYNYLFYQNTHFGNKIFYAFITNREYINPNTTLITFKIDKIQTYFLFNCTLKQCLIERETIANDDDLSLMRISEDLGVGEYELLEESVGDFDEEVGDLKVVIACSPSAFAEAGVPALFRRPGWFGKVFFPYYFTVYSLNSSETIDLFMEQMAQQGVADTVSMFIFFEDCIPDRDGDPVIFEKDIEVPFNWNTGTGISLNGYIPKNNKLYTYPYTVLNLNGYGEVQNLKYEEITTKTMRLYIPFTASAVPFMWVKGYDRQSNYLDGGISGKALPLYAYSYNAAINTWNQSRQQRAANIESAALATTASLVGSISSGRELVSGGKENILGTIDKFQSTEIDAFNPNYKSLQGMLTKGNIGVSNAAFSYAANIGGSLATNPLGNTLRTLQAQKEDAELRPHNLQNQNIIPELNFILNWKTPFWCGRTQKRQYLENIDAFFTMYGYRVNRLAIPNFKSRPRFNYLKCSVCNLDGDCTESDIVEIKTILENGIRFWHDKTNIGNYTLANK